MTKKITALPYQKEGVWDIEDFDGRALLADEMGLGKTLQALWFIKRQKQPTLPAVVICPSSVKYNWEHSAREHTGMTTHVIEGRGTTKTKSSITETADITIINYEILQYWVKHLRNLHPMTVVIDECHYLQNRTTKRTKSARALCKGIRNVIAVSGTPLLNKPSELWPTLNIIRPDLYPSFFTFGMEFCKPRKSPWGWQYNGATNLPKLHAQLRRKLMIRRLKKDVIKDLPHKMREVVCLGLTHPKEYHAANTDFSSWMKQNHAASFMRASKAESLTKIGYLLRLSAKLKARAVVEWVNNFLEKSDEKLVLFAIHKKMIRVLKKRINFKSVVVDGTVGGRDRYDAVAQFRKDPNTRLFIANIQAAGTGIDGLQDAASTMAFAELAWRPGDHTQAEDRLHRIGQEDVSWIYYLIAGHTIEEKLCKLIQEKQSILRSVLDGGQAPEQDLNVLDQLIALMETTVK
jgi:SWI/SNF-related matrix-associated actin-dependent regulator 1 of chromatin subfamily A